MSNAIATIQPSSVANAIFKIDATPDWIAHFWSRADRGECWNWLGGSTPKGYGVHCTKALKIGKMRYAHRIAYALTHGPFPNRLKVCHHCDNPRCIRPDHLFLGTQLDNMQDAKRKGRLDGKTRTVTDDMVRAIRRRYEADKPTFYALGAEFGISYQHAHAIVRRHKYLEVE